MQTCRFCKSSENEDQMVKYEVRHYAHFECYLRAKKPLSDLWAWQIKQFPYRLLKEYGLLNEARALIAAEDAA